MKPIENSGCVSRSTYQALQARRKSPAKEVMVRRQNNDGKFGKPFSTTVYGDETPEDVIKRLESLNGRKFILSNDER